MNIDQETTRTQREKILNLLRLAGPKGVTNFELSRICLRYSARIWELIHEEKFDIRGSWVGGGEEREYRYILRAEGLPLFRQRRAS